MIGCSRPPTPEGNSTPITVDGSRLTIGTTAKVRTLDPADAYETFTGNLLFNLGDRLYTYKSGTTELIPQLAAAMPQVSRDGLTYTIPLRDNVVFHDDTPFNAEAMAFSLQRFIENGGQPAFLLKDTIASVEATGEQELTIQLQKPFASFPDLLAFSGLAAISPQAYEVGTGKFLPAQFVGTGPYTLAQYGSDSLKLEAFENYWGEQPQNQQIDIQIFSSSANLFNAFRTGSIDIAYQSLNPDQVESLERSSAKGDWQTITGPGSNITYLSLNLRQSPLDQDWVRQALALMVDRQLLQSRVFNGQVDPLLSLIPTIYPASKPVFKGEGKEANIAKARDLIAQAGYSSSNPLSIDLWYRSNVPSDAPAAATLKASIERSLGGAVNLVLNSVESATAYTNLEKGIYPMFMLDYSGDFFDPDTYTQPFLACTQGSVETGCEEGATVSQGSFYYSDRVNQLIDQSRQEADPQKRQQTLAEIQEITGEDVPFIPLWERKEYAFAQQNVKGVGLEPTQHLPFWTLSKS